MSKFGTNPDLHRDPCKALRRCASIAALGAIVAAFAIGASALAQASDKIPDLASAQFAWLARATSRRGATSAGLSFLTVDASRCAGNFGGGFEIVLVQLKDDKTVSRDRSPIAKYRILHSG